MPVASVSDDRQRFELKSCPGGFVVLRRMAYGDKMLRRQEISKATVQTSGSKSKSADGFTAQMQMMNESVTQLEFSKSIVEHNLTYLRVPGDMSTETPLDFTNPQHVRLLDGRVGEEIDDLITTYNNYEGDADTKG